MALQASTLKTRSLTALVFVGVMGVGLFFNIWSYLLLFLFVLTVAWLEFGKLIDRIADKSMHLYVSVGWILNGLAICLLISDEPLAIGGYPLQGNLIFPLHLAGFIFLIWGTLASKGLSIKHWLLFAAGNLYVTLPVALTIHLYGFGPLPIASDLCFTTAVWWVVVAIAVMWTNDTMAYLLGSLIGRTPFSKISPKKTWEGTLSGILCATALIGWVLDRYLNDEVFHPLTGYMLVFLLAVAGTVGDLVESKLKRLAGVKDSGHLMPGHGGVLDRFDSFLFAIPVLYLFLRIISLGD